MFGNDGSDIFVIKSAASRNRIIIEDYTDGVDMLKLSATLSFGDLSIQNSNDNTATLIKESATNNILAVLSNIDSTVTVIDSSDFI